MMISRELLLMMITRSTNNITWIQARVSRGNADDQTSTHSSSEFSPNDNEMQSFNSGAAKLPRFTTGFVWWDENCMSELFSRRTGDRTHFVFVVSVWRAVTEQTGGVPAGATGTTLLVTTVVGRYDAQQDINYHRYDHSLSVAAAWTR